MGGIAVAVGHGADGSESAYGYARSLGSPIGAGGVEVASANAVMVRLCMGVARGVRGAALLLGGRVGGCGWVCGGNCDHRAVTRRRHAVVGCLW